MNKVETRLAMVNTFERIRLPWVTWSQSEPAAKLDELKAAEAAVLCVLQLLHRQACMDEPPIDVLWDPKENTTVVVTTARVDAFKLHLAPCIPKTMKLRSDSDHPERIKITVNAKQQGAILWTRDLFLHPEWQGPADEMVEGVHAVASRANIVHGNGQGGRQCIRTGLYGVSQRKNSRPRFQEATST